MPSKIVKVGAVAAVLAVVVIVAVVVMNSRTSAVLITAPPGSAATLNVAEVHVMSGGKILTGTAKIIPEFLWEGTNQFPASNALDRDSGTFAHSDHAENANLKITLKSSAKVDKIVVFNRRDCCQERLIGCVLYTVSSLGMKKKIGVLNADLVQEFKL